MTTPANPAPVVLKNASSAPVVNTPDAEMTADQVQAFIAALLPLLALPSGVEASSIRSVTIGVRADGTGWSRLKYQAKV